MTLTRDEILAKRSAAVRESLEIPELGGSVLIKALTLREVAEFQRTQKATSNLDILYPKIISIGCVGEDGNPLFVGEDIKLLTELPWTAMDALATAILRLNKMTGESDANGKPAGPKDSSPTSDSATDSPPSSTAA
jgi:hypothetical protein